MRLDHIDPIASVVDRMIACTTKSAGPRPGSGARQTLAAAGILAIASLFTSGPANAADAETALAANYTISVAGVTIGTVEANIRLTDTDYAAIIQGRTSGISSLVSDAKATLLASGQISKKRLLPATYDLETSEGEFETHVRMKVRAGTVTDLLAIPSLRGVRDRVPLDPRHKRGIVDPVTAFIVVTETSGTADDRRICQRTVNIFDGWQRFDVKLSYKATRQIDGTGEAYDGKVVVCSARYAPVAGHLLGQKTTRYMAENKRLEVWFAPIKETRLLIPYRLLIGTSFGDLVIKARRFVTSGPSADP